MKKRKVQNVNHNLLLCQKGGKKRNVFLGLHKKSWTQEIHKNDYSHVCTLDIKSGGQYGLFTAFFLIRFGVSDHVNYLYF